MDKGHESKYKKENPRWKKLYKEAKENLKKAEKYNLRKE